MTIYDSSKTTIKEEDLKKRFKEFALTVIRFAKGLPDTFEIRIIKSQMVDSGTSPGANYRAACRAKSGPDFINKLKIVEEELDETQYWLELVVGLLPEKDKRLRRFGRKRTSFWPSL